MHVFFLALTPIFGMYKDIKICGLLNNGRWPKGFLYNFGTIYPDLNSSNGHVKDETLAATFLWVSTCQALQKIIPCMKIDV